MKERYVDRYELALLLCMWEAWGRDACSVASKGWVDILGHVDFSVSVYS